MITLLLAARPDTQVENLPPFLAPIGTTTVLGRITSQVLRTPDDTVLLATNTATIDRWNLNHVVERIAPNIEIVRVQSGTMGATCTALLAIDRIPKSAELLILAADEFMTVEYDEILSTLRSAPCDAGVVTFPSWHPRFSYVDLNDGYVVRAAEKDPISDSATAGFYWYRKAETFFNGAFEQIRKRDSVNSNYYICPVFNQLILDGKRILSYEIGPDQYIPLKTPGDLIALTKSEQ